MPFENYPRGGVLKDPNFRPNIATFPGTRAELRLILEHDPYQQNPNLFIVTCVTDPRTGANKYYNCPMPKLESLPPEPELPKAEPEKSLDDDSYMK
jgi:hypothetical protein